MVYHHFQYPNGICIGRAASYTPGGIDKLEFNKNGSIKQAKPTHPGVKAVSVLYFAKDKLVTIQFAP